MRWLAHDNYSFYRRVKAKARLVWCMRNYWAPTHTHTARWSPDVAYGGSATHPRRSWTPWPSRRSWPPWAQPIAPMLRITPPALLVSNPKNETKIFVFIELPFYVYWSDFQIGIDFMKIYFKWNFSFWILDPLLKRQKFYTRYFCGRKQQLKRKMRP